MTPFSPKEAREVVEMFRAYAVFDPAKGGKCPVCGAWARVRSTKGKTRYHVCWRCFHRFNSLK